MELWKVLLGCLLAIPAGIALGMLYCYVHFRVVYKAPVSLRAIGSVLSALSPQRFRPIPSVAAASSATRKYSGRPAVLKMTAPSAPRVIRPVAIPAAAGRAPSLAASKAQTAAIPVSANKSSFPASGAIEADKTPVVKMPEPTPPASGHSDVPSIPVGKTVSLPSGGAQSAARPNQTDSRPASPSNGDRSPVLMNIASGPTPSQPSPDYSKPPEPPKQQRSERLSVLLDELESNLAAIRGRSDDELVPLKTASWDANQQVFRGLSQELRDGLESIYVDINLLNHLVWLSSEFDRRSPSMCQHYLELAQSISGRIDGVIRCTASQAACSEPVSTP